MARESDRRIQVRGTLVTQSPLHVGGMGESGESDMPLARDGADRLVVPGTSLTGALRQWCEGHFPPSLVEALWGALPDHPDDDERAASSLFVADALIGAGGPSSSVLLDGVGIHRGGGTASPGLKFDRMVLVPGTPLRLSLTLEVPPKGDTRVAALGHLLRALTEGRISLGAATSRGLGRVRLDADSLTIHEEDLRSRAGLLAILKNSAPRRSVQALIDGDPSLRPDTGADLTLSVDWSPVGPVMVKDGRSGRGVKIMPLVTIRKDQTHLLLPGSAVKGAIRSHAEKIVRTVLDRPGPDPRARHAGPMEEVPLVRHLFGVAGRRGAWSDDGAMSSGRGALSVADCLSAPVLPAGTWRMVLEAEDPAAVQAALSSETETTPLLKPTLHVAIDRWTGGAAENRLFSVLEPHGVTWAPLTLHLDTSRLAPSEHMPALALLLLVLEDLHAGRMTLGYGGNRGMGAARVDHLGIEGGAADPTEIPIATEPDQPGVLSALTKESRSSLAAAWGNWVREMGADQTREETA